MYFLDRFLDKIEITATCWLWKADLDRHGYGRFRLKNKTVLAHRFSYELFNGELINGLVLDHLCRNTKCVNPRHLEQVDDRTNIIRGLSFSAKNSKKTHCAQGHEFTPENTYHTNDGKRVCRQCRIIWCKKSDLKKRCELA